MPTYTTIRLPPPTDGTEFEDITLSALRTRWQSPNLEKNGRKGQAQAGVDIYGQDDLGRNVGIQCKATQELTLATIKSEAEAADSFEPPLNALYFATTLPTDAKLQKEVRIFSEQRLHQKKFPVAIIFWESIVSALISRPDLMRAHYPQFFADQSAGHPGGSRILSAIDIGMLGTNLKYRMGLLFGEMGLLSNEDPASFSYVTLRLESCGTILFQEPARSDFIDLNRNLLAGSLRIALGQAEDHENWHTVEMFATKIEAYVEALENQLSQSERAAYICGRILGKWDQIENKNLPKSFIAVLTEAVECLQLPSSVSAVVQAKAKEFEESKSIQAIHIPSFLYREIRGHLALRELKSKA